jgi:hypothetical protein
MVTHTIVQKWFDSAPSKKKMILEALRKIILSQNNMVAEEIKWNRPCYSNNGRLFCYLNMTKKSVTLGFEKGTSLTDPSKILKGTGKEMRHINISTLEELHQPEIQQLIEEACNT